MSTPAIDEARRIYQESFTAYQNALAAVAIGQSDLQVEVASGRLKPGTPEYFAAEKRLVVDTQAAARTAELQRDQNFNQLDLLLGREQTARELALARQQLQAAQEAPIATEVSTNLLPNQNAGTPTPGLTPIIGVDEINARANLNDSIEIPLTNNTFVQTGTGLNVSPEDVDALVDGPTQEDLIRLNDGSNLGVADENGFVVDPVTGLNVLPEDVPVDEVDGYLTEFTPEGSRVLTPEEIQRAADEAAARERARLQQSIADQRRQINNGDWRVRLRLAPRATYLYNAPNPGILQPLQVTDGVIFPYTPNITTSYRAKYSEYELTHANFKGYFYQSSFVEPIQLTATFTAQNTAEANYLLAVIHFFRSVTKMFYGQDAERGVPPPLTYLTGLGEFQFNEHPCLVSQFNYVLPPDVDYIRAGSPNQLNQNQISQRDRQSTWGGILSPQITRMIGTGLTFGAIPNPPATPSFGQNRPTYVPTKMEISLTLLPVQSRGQVSKQFSLKNFANGNLLKGGFW